MVISFINEMVWGIPALLLILGIGLYLTVRLDFAQIRLFPDAIRNFLHQLLPGKQEENRSSYQALCTALAATVGTGNLVGVSGAICLGGPGAIFWMWICGILGMVTKYTEALLSICYRVKVEDGYAGGPMYMVTRGLPRRLHFLAWLYAAFGLIASFGVGNAAQVNAAMSGIRECFRYFGKELPPSAMFMMTVLFAGIIGVLLFGGAKAISAAAERLVPLTAGVYILLCVGVLLLKWRMLPSAFNQIVVGAFHPQAVTGGLIGSAFLSLRIGCSRGVFTNEAGLGTAAIAHAGAGQIHPVRQGLMGIMEVFLDTLVICTLTALVILVSDAPVPYGVDAGGALTIRAFSTVHGGCASLWLTGAMTLFATATVLGWGLYGARCAEFLFGSQAWRVFAALQIPVIFAGVFLRTDLIWQISETINGLMTIPNLITLALLAPEAARLTIEYRKSGNVYAGGGNYANFHQRKPL